MKNVFTDRDASEFSTLLCQFTDSLRETCDDDDDVRDWCTQWSQDKVQVKTWYECVTSSLDRSHAKYVRAVTLIIDRPACLYHAIKYRDVSAIVASKRLFLFDVNTVLSRLSSDDVRLFWRYVDELNVLAFRWANEEAPVVPTSAEISQNIARRRASRNAVGDSVESRGMLSGILDLWTRVAALRHVDPVPKLDDSDLQHLSTVLSSSTWTDDAIPQLGTGPYTSEQRTILESMNNLIIMKNTIPHGMMQNIESAASKLVHDMNNGTCDMSNLNLASIGDEVLSRVSEDDINSFAGNLGKIVPAMESLGRTSS